MSAEFGVLVPRAKDPLAFGGRVGLVTQGVYSELADYLVKRFDLSEKPGIGIDIGGGPGDLIVHLAKRTRQYYWINVDINTWCTRPFAMNAIKENIGHRTGRLC